MASQEGSFGGRCDHNPTKFRPQVEWTKPVASEGWKLAVAPGQHALWEIKPLGLSYTAELSGPFLCVGREQSAWALGAGFTPKGC